MLDVCDAIDLDAIDCADVLVDTLMDVTDADDVAEDGAGDAGDVTVDATSDVFMCGNVPQEGCPCDRFNDEPCCLMAGKGLSCGYEMINGVLMVIWGVFWDCGCIEGPPCDGWEFYGLCPGAVI